MTDQIQVAPLKANDGSEHPFESLTPELKAMVLLRIKWHKEFTEIHEKLAMIDMAGSSLSAQIDQKLAEKVIGDKAVAARAALDKHVVEIDTTPKSNAAAVDAAYNAKLLQEAADGHVTPAIKKAVKEVTGSDAISLTDDELKQIHELGKQAARNVQK